MGLYDFSLYDMICRNARCFRDRSAWFEVDTGTTTTFGQYKKQVDRLAAGLHQVGIKTGDRIGVVGKNSLGFFQIYGDLNGPALIQDHAAHVDHGRVGGAIRRLDRHDRRGGVQRDGIP